MAPPHRAPISVDTDSPVVDCGTPGFAPWQASKAGSALRPAMPRSAWFTTSPHPAPVTARHAERPSRNMNPSLFSKRARSVSRSLVYLENLRQ
jgi:hypothetical protein